MKTVQVLILLLSLNFASLAETREQLVKETADKDAQEYFDSDVKKSSSREYDTVMQGAADYARGAAMGHGFAENYKALYVREFTQDIVKLWYYGKL
jgi:hypothetical protein